MGTFHTDDFTRRGLCHYEALLKEGEGSQAFRKNLKWHYKLQVKQSFSEGGGLARQSNFLFIV